MNWQKSILKINSTLQEAIENLNKSSSKIILIVDQNDKFKGTVTDGDIRRALLKNLNLKNSINDVINYNPLTVEKNLDIKLVKELMEKNKIQQIPIINKKNEILGLHLWDELSNPILRDNYMIIMAGGKGTRLLPYSQNISKTMLNVGGKPILHRIIDKAKKDGFRNFIISVNHLSETIESYFKDGTKFDVNITYIKEEESLGTAGALSLIKNIPNNDFIVTNGDVLVDLKYSEILEFHKKNNCCATMAVKPHEIQNPFGVVKMSGIDITNIEEKPIYQSYINAGVYALSPKSLKYLEKNVFCNMTTLFEKIKNSMERISGFPILEYWIDIGIPEDLNKANNKEN